jgi:ankyrin repeat protein
MEYGVDIEMKDGVVIKNNLISLVSVSKLVFKYRGLTPLMTAASHGHLDIVHMPLEADMNAQSNVSLSYLIIIFVWE